MSYESIAFSQELSSNFSLLKKKKERKTKLSKNRVKNKEQWNPDHKRYFINEIYILYGIYM